MSNNIHSEAGALREEIVSKLQRHFGREVGSASRGQIFKACALLLRDRMSSGLVQRTECEKVVDRRQVHYMSLEFLLGRSLMKNAYNLGVLEDLTQALISLGVEPSEIFDQELDAGLGNGGLGRLAACYMDSMTTLEVPATGYSICYHYGIFRQKIVEGQQVELPDPWLETGDVWLIPHVDEAEEVRFSGVVDQVWEEDGHARFLHRDYTSVLAIPMDMAITGFRTGHVNTLRLWDSKSTTQIDMSLFSRGEYLRALEQNALAEVISKVLYPEDNHFEGKLLRLRQQYFFVSATVQSIARRHRARYGTLGNFHLRHVIQINDTHPTLVIPELMRIFLDEEGMEWDEAWSIVTHAVAYTNHTVMSEALERWSQPMVEMLLPRIWMILCEINNRYLRTLSEDYHYTGEQLAQAAVIWDGEVRMANLCVCACFAINGVSELHSTILRQTIFRDAFERTPHKFFNITNGIDHRRWLAQINPRLHALICELTGSDEYLLRPAALEKLGAFANDASALRALGAIKRENKQRLSNYIRSETGLLVDPDSLFDIQVKRLHEYKRQLLNVMHIIALYNSLRDNPRQEMQPRTFLFGAKAASGYQMAKRIIRLINSLAEQINGDPLVAGRIRLVFLENYRVSVAELLMPAAEISEQISTAGKEASGTGNMKFMINGALTLGTLDGANVEISEEVGLDNIFLFGHRAEEV
ncbi:MAG: glycogen/starch/alpha-glucan family phosphorylase, partial [Oscillospiraceae bacterium]|nr:glycogen/starch/alpha-glucan family phosphorylase [Oscillospiraceae bacterium]